MEMHGENITATTSGGGDSQQIPYQKPLRTWAGHGSGTPCDLCKRPIATHEIEYEVEIPVGKMVRVLKMHFACHQKWASEGRRRQR